MCFACVCVSVCACACECGYVCVSLNYLTGSPSRLRGVSKHRPHTQLFLQLHLTTSSPTAIHNNAHTKATPT